MEHIKDFVLFFEGIRDQYSKMGVDNYYTNHKATYVNPHQENINECLDWVIDKINIGYFLDLSCGNGEVSSHLSESGLNNFKGCDPHFSEIYSKNFNKECYDFKFEDISKNSLPEKFDSIICSYAIHLCPKSYFNGLLYNLSINSRYLVVISPSKYPDIECEYFNLVDKTVINRTHCRIFESIN